MQIKFNHVFFTYNANSPFSVNALTDINLDLNENNITAIVGRTGSGKSTLTELINKLLTPTKIGINVTNNEQIIENIKMIILTHKLLKQVKN